MFVSSEPKKAFKASELCQLRIIIGHKSLNNLVTLSSFYSVWLVQRLNEGDWKKCHARANHTRCLVRKWRSSCLRSICDRCNRSKQRSLSATWSNATRKASARISPASLFASVFHTFCAETIARRKQQIVSNLLICFSAVWVYSYFYLRLRKKLNHSKFRLQRDRTPVFLLHACAVQIA